MDVRDNIAGCWPPLNLRGICNNVVILCTIESI